MSGSTLSLQNFESYPGLADPERKSYVHVLTGGGRGFVTDIEEVRASDIVCADMDSTLSDARPARSGSHFPEGSARKPFFSRCALRPTCFRCPSIFLDRSKRWPGRTEPFPSFRGRTRRADILTFEEPTTGLQRGPFYHLSRPNASGWREVGENGSAASIQPLDFLSILVLRRDGNAGYVLVEGSLDPPAVPRLAAARSGAGRSSSEGRT